MTTTVVIPCYNERERLSVPTLLHLCGIPGFKVVFVDDGSTDGTHEVLAAIVEQASGKARLLRLPSNVGKGEAVRQGLLEAMLDGAAVVGFVDADMSTPVSEIHRLAVVAEGLGVDVVLGARVRLAGRTVERHPYRHYLGRVVATYVGVRTRLPVYDTQCGTKFFRTNPELREALRVPFATRWLFDIELLRRLHNGHCTSGRPLRLREEPLETWVDVGGTRLRGIQLVMVARDFARLERQLRAPVAQGGRGVSALRTQPQGTSSQKATA